MDWYSSVDNFIRLGVLPRLTGNGLFNVVWLKLLLLDPGELADEQL